jgi:Kef-type K+ transport system membrane component KefB
MFLPVFLRSVGVSVPESVIDKTAPGWFEKLFIDSVNSLQIFLISFAIIFGCALTGLFLQRFIPNTHTTGDSKDAVKLGAGILASMAALVLGLMVSSAKGTFDSVNQQISNAAAMDMQLARVLQQYGPGADPIREELRKSISNRVRDIWPEEQPPGPADGPAAGGDRTQAASLETMIQIITALEPQTALQRKLQDSASAWWTKSSGTAIPSKRFRRGTFRCI